MSALCGFLNLDSVPADPALVTAQLARLEHLGPDGSGSFMDGPVALGHALLSITPESEQENSPWRGTDGRHAIAFDGRLDHRDDLYAALGVPMAERGVPDPELVLRAHEKWGADCAAHLEGEFAFALWDGRTRELFCAVDAFGARDFFHHTDGHRFVFATAIRGVLALPGVPRELDELTLACQLGGVPRHGDHTLYAGIRRLPGARTLTVRPGGAPQVRQYWQLTMEPEIRLRRPEDYAEALREMLDRATRSALRTRYPVAAMLSGGLDSTGIACLAARELAARGQRLTTVSNILPDDYHGGEWNREESGFIRSALEKYPNMDALWSRGLVFPVVQFDDAHYRLNDTPDDDTKSFRTRELFQLAQGRGARVVLGGLGGDMAASFKGTGYLEQLARGGHWLDLVRQIRLQARARGETARGIFRREVLRPFTPRWLRRWNDRLRNARPEEADRFAIHPAFAERMNLAELRSATAQDHDLHLDFRVQQVRMVNAGMLGAGASWTRPHCPQMESPQPLMNRRIWDWCHRVPLGEFIRDGRPRGLYRRALHDVLPEPVLRRTSKGWFAPDLQQRLVACAPAIADFLAQHPAGDAVWSYVHRPKVEATLRLITGSGGADTWDNRYQIILCAGLRRAHFVSWLRRTA